MKKIVLVCVTVAVALIATASVAENCWLRLKNGDVDVLGEWRGPCKDGKPYGKGKAYLANGIYEGAAKDGLAHGKGSLSLGDGGRYDGDWAGGRPHGQGAAVDADGDRYVGQFVQGEPQGRGEGWSPGGGRHTGLWDDGNPVVQSEAVAPAGARTSGNGVSSSPGGGPPRCKLTVDGESLDWSGPCENGLASGEGRAKGPDGSSYAGSAMNGKPHGFGTVNATDGYYQGGFLEGLPHGDGVFQGSDGRYYQAVFRDGFQATDEVPVEGASAGKSPWDEPVERGPGQTAAKNSWDSEEEAQNPATAASRPASAPGEDPNDDAYDSYRAAVEAVGKGDGTVRVVLPNDSYTAALTEMERREAEQRATAAAREAERHAAEVRERIEVEQARERQARNEAERQRRRAALERAARQGAAALNRDLYSKPTRQRSGGTFFGSSGNSMQDLARKLREQREQRERLARQRQIEEQRRNAARSYWSNSGDARGIPIPPPTPQMPAPPTRYHSGSGGRSSGAVQ